MRNKNLKFIFLIVFTILIFGVVFIFKYFNLGTSLVWDISKGGKLLLPLVIISALIDSINPCAFSILLVTIAFLFSIGRLRSNILTIGIFYIIGIFLAYFLIGLGLLRAFHLFGIPNFMAKLGAALLFIFGLINIFESSISKFPKILQIPNSAHLKMAGFIEKSSISSAFSLGMLVGLCEFPCTGGPYLMILGLLHDSSTFLTGFQYLFLYNLIFVSPLLFILLITSNEMVLNILQNWQKSKRKKERLIAGIGMVILGLLIFII